MECIVFSDTHGNYPLAVEIYYRSAPVDVIFHLGDKAEDAEMIERVCLTRVEKVAGNCDAPGRYDRELLNMVGNTRILMTHGDLYGVKAGMAKLVEHGTAACADLVLYGHTHQASIERINGILFVNPGTLQHGSVYKSYAHISITGHGIEAGIQYLDG